MIAVQKELTDLKSKGTETELQLKQDKRIGQLEKQMNKYKEDCTNIMKYCSLQGKLIQEKSLKSKELKEDEKFLEEQLMEIKIENYNLKTRLAKSHNDCKHQTEMNMQTNDELDLLRQSVENHVLTNLSVDQATTAVGLMSIDPQMPSVNFKPQGESTN